MWLVVEGGRAITVGGSVLRLREGMLCMIFPGQQHQTVFSSADLRGWRAVAAPELIELISRVPGAPVFRPPGTATLPLVARVIAADLRWLYERFTELSALPVGSTEFQVGLSYVLLRGWRLCVASAIAGAPASALVLRAVQLLEDSPGRLPWSVTALARTLGISPGQLQRRFRAETGQTVTRYRLAGQLARYLDLSDDDHDLSITDAAYAAGFGSYAQFHRIFVRYMDVSPSRHRSRRRGGLVRAPESESVPAWPSRGQ